MMYAHANVATNPRQQPAAQASGNLAPMRIPKR
jgi:hypothetical protein